MNQNKILSLINQTEELAKNFRLTAGIASRSLSYDEVAQGEEMESFAKQLEIEIRRLPRVRSLKLAIGK